MADSEIESPVALPTPDPTDRESPFRRTVGATLLSALNLLLKIGSNVIILPLSLKYLGREEYGLWIILQSVASYLMLSELGLGQTLMNLQGVAFARRDHDQVSRLLTTGFGLYWLLITPVWILSVIVITTQPVEVWLLKDIPSQWAAVFKWYLLVAATLALARVPATAFPATLLGLRELTLRQILDGVQTVFLVIGTALTLALHGKLLALILVTNLGLISITLLGYPLARWRHPAVRLASRFWTPSWLKLLFSNSSFFFLYGLGLLFQRLAGNLLAGKFGSLAQVPKMFVLLTLFRVVGWSLADIVSRTLQPYIILFSAQGRREKVLFLAKLCTKCTFALGVVFTVLIWVFADVGLEWWLGPEMFLGYGPLGYLAGAFLIDILFLPTSNFMIALNRQRLLSLSMAGYALLSFALGVVGAKWWMPADPLYGLCVGFFAASVGQALVLPWITHQWLQIGWRCYTNDLLLKPGVLAIGGVLIAVLDWVGGTRVWHGGLGALGGLVCLPLATWFFILEEEERRWLNLLFLGRQVRKAD